MAGAVDRIRDFQEKGLRRGREEQRVAGIPIGDHLADLPWVKPSEEPDAVRRLNEEMTMLYEYIRETEKEEKARRKAIEELEEVAGGVQLSVLLAMRMDLPASTIDVQAIAKGSEPDDKETNQILRQIKMGIEEKEMAAGTSLVHASQARTPFVSYKEKRYGYTVNITVEAHKTVKLLSFMEDEISKRGEGVTKMALVVAYILRGRGLFKVHGGMDLHSLFLMVIFFFRTHPLLQCRSIDPVDNLGVLLMDFFQFFGRDFDQDRVALDVKSGKFVPKPQACRAALCVQGPAGRENVSEELHQYLTIKGLFYHLYRGMLILLRDVPPQGKPLSSFWVSPYDKEKEWRKHVEGGGPEAC